MKTFFWLGPVLLGWIAFVSCRKEAPAPTIASLHFPVVLFFENSGARTCASAKELTEMHTNYLKLNSTPPRLVDSELKIYSLANFQSVHSGLWLMANPSAMTEVTFDLKAEPSGLERARELFRRELDRQTWRDDLGPARDALAKHETLLEMVQATRPPEN